MRWLLSVGDALPASDSTHTSPEPVAVDDAREPSSGESTDRKRCTPQRIARGAPSALRARRTAARRSRSTHSALLAVVCFADSPRRSVHSQPGQSSSESGDDDGAVEWKNDSDVERGGVANTTRSLDRSTEQHKVSRLRALRVPSQRCTTPSGSDPLIRDASVSLCGLTQLLQASSS